MKTKSVGASSIFAMAVFLAISLVSPVSLRGQEARGTITGNVKDPIKGVVPGASVKITNVAMGTTVSVSTNDAGFFQAPYLLPGTYQIVVESTGFKKYVRDGVELRIGDTVAIDAQLEVGTIDQEVTITAQGPALDSTSASMGQTVDSRRVAELPLVHGDPYTMIGLTPGVTFARDQRLDRPFEPTHIVGFTIDGTRANRSDLTIDGTPSTARANGNEVIASYVPPTDIIQEFKVQTATFDSQFGNTEGGVTSIGIKSGTNSIHGTGYIWLEPGGLAANDFFGNLRGQPRPDTYSNRPGFSIGGPIIIPKLYDGRNKTFFLWGFEDIHDSRPRYDSTSPSVPTDAMKRGDFSALLALGPQYQIYNPFSRRKDPARPGHFIEDPFAGNIIPGNLINPVSKALLQFFPAPKSAGTAEFLNNNSDSTLAEQAKYNTNTVRIDHVISEKQRIFGRASWYRRDSTYDDYFHNAATGTFFQFFSRQAVIDDVYVFNATTVLNVKYGYNRFIRSQDMIGGHGFDLTSVGFPSSYNSALDPSIRRFPRFDFPAGTYQGTGQTNEFRPNDSHSFSGTVNKTVGTHSLKAGMEFRAYRQNDIFASNSQTGQFVFDNTYTKQKDDSSATQVGLSFASFLLGVPTSSSGVTRAADFAEQSTTWGFFVQDDWKVTPRLTLNLGLRYEFEGPMTERYNRSVTGFDASYVQPIQAAARAKYTSPIAEVPTLNVQGGLLFAGVNGQPSGLYQTPKNSFMPRFGLAYKLNEKTVLRGGYGIFFGFLGQRRSDVIQTGYSITTNFVPTTDGFTFSSTLANPFPNGILNPQGAALGLQTNLGNNISFFNQHPLSPYNQRWEIGIQRELLGGILIEASYVGNRGTHIEISRDINTVPNQFLSILPTRDTTRISYLTGNVPNPFAGLGIPGVGAPSNISRQNLMKPFPEFGSITTTDNTGYSWYHAGELRIEKRFSHGYTVQASFTHSRFMQATELLNPGDPRPTKVVSDSDYPNRLAVSAIYELPFGNGHLFLSGSNAVVSRLVGGWQVQTVFAHQSGAPLTWGNYSYNGNFSDIAIPSDQRSLGQWFNNTGFVALRTSTGTVVTSNGQPVWVSFTDPCKNSYSASGCAGTPLTNPLGFNRDSAFQLANNLRTFPLRFSNLRVEATDNVDFSVLKNTRIKERASLQFRAEFTNFFNHPWLSAASGASGTSGVITSPTNADFGKIANISNQGNYPRRVQLGIKVIF
jgi:hypothetical protein